MNSTLKNTSQIILSTALINIADATGQYHACKAVLDSGSQSNFISEQYCDKLKLFKKTVDIPISGIGETIYRIRCATRVTIKSRTDAFTLNINCLIIPKVTEPLPTEVIKRKILNFPKDIILADPTFDQPSHIDMLIGAEYFYQLLCSSQIKLNSGATILQETRFGWIVTGKFYVPGPISRQFMSPLSKYVRRDSRRDKGSGKRKGYLNGNYYRLKRKPVKNTTNKQWRRLPQDIIR